MIFESHQLLSYFLLILNSSLAFGWESIDTCQMSFVERLEDVKWYTYLYAIDFSTDKSNMYDILKALDPAPDVNPGFAEISDITNINFDISAEDDETVQTGTLFGESFTITNFTMYAETAFEAQTDGDYTFTLEATDAAYVAISTDMSPYCCGNVNDPNAETVFNDGLKYIWSIPSDPTPRDNTITVSMKEGVPYYIRILYRNLSGDAKLKFTMTTPDGKTTSDFSDFVGYPAAVNCDNVHTTSRD